MLHLDLLRFVAASGIVFHHSKEFFIERAERAAAHERSEGLALFVDLFFVISGYVIAHVYANRMSSLAEYGRFIQRRIGRLVPLHWLTLVCAIVLWMLLLKVGARPTHAVSFRPECIVITAALLHGGMSRNGTIFNPQSWSISAEMAMYLAFPLFAFLGIKRPWLPLLLGAAVLAVLLTVLARQHDVSLMETWTQSLSGVVRALPSFIIGVGLWFVREQLRRFPCAQPILLGSVVTLAVSMIIGVPILALLMLIYLTAVAAIAADVQKRGGRAVVALAPFGQVTYSIYMWHLMFILVLMNALGDKVLHAGGWIMALLALLTYGLILGWGYFSFVFIETPARRWVDSLPPFGRAAVSAAVVRAAGP